MLEVGKYFEVGDPEYFVTNPQAVLGNPPNREALKPLRRRLLVGRGLIDTVKCFL